MFKEIVCGRNDKLRFLKNAIEKRQKIKKTVNYLRLLINKKN